MITMETLIDKVQACNSAVGINSNLEIFLGEGDIVWEGKLSKEEKLVLAETMIHYWTVFAKQVKKGNL